MAATAPTTSPDTTPTSPLTPTTLGTATATGATLDAVAAPRGGAATGATGAPAGAGGAPAGAGGAPAGGAPASATADPYNLYYSFSSYIDTLTEYIAQTQVSIQQKKFRAEEDFARWKLELTNFIRHINTQLNNPSLLDPEIQIPYRAILKDKLTKLSAILLDITQEEGFSELINSMVREPIEKIQKAENVAIILARLNLLPGALASVGTGKTLNTDDIKSLLEQMSEVKGPLKVTLRKMEDDLKDGDTIIFSIHDQGTTTAGVSTGTGTSAASPKENIENLLPTAADESTTIGELKVNKKSGQFSINTAANADPGFLKSAYLELLIKPAMKKALSGTDKTLAIEAIPDGNARQVFAEALVEAAVNSDYSEFEGFTKFNDNSLNQEFAHQMTKHCLNLFEKGTIDGGKVMKFQESFKHCPDKIKEVIQDDIRKGKYNIERKKAAASSSGSTSAATAAATAPPHGGDIPSLFTPEMMRAFAAAAGTPAAARTSATPTGRDRSLSIDD